MTKSAILGQLLGLSNKNNIPTFIGVYGDQLWGNKATIDRVLFKQMQHYPDLTIITGTTNKGVDRLVTYLVQNEYRIPLYNHPFETVFINFRLTCMILFCSDFRAESTRYMFNQTKLANVPRVWYTEHFKEVDERYHSI